MDQLYEFDVLRVDRTTAAHGLEVREPFLDKAWMQHYFNLPANVKCPRNNIEKYHLRKAIDVTFPDLLPQEILWRQKEAFSDGVSSLKKKSWVDELKDYAESIITDEQFEEERRQYDPMPMFKDALLLRRIYNKHYGMAHPPLVSKYWVPRWVGENPDSSARKLKDLFNADAEDDKMRSFDLYKGKMELQDEKERQKVILGMEKAHK
jgi:asparagine synthase (glutamine-hydrolysing)